MAFEKEYIITQIRASSDVSPYVYISLKDPDEPDDQTHGVPFRAFSMGSMDDIMENLSKAFTQQMNSNFTTIIKLTEDEYKDMDIRVGDRIALQIKKRFLGIK
ncbi:MAG: hypothetical protein ACLFVP_00630 [Candidatus Bathyarchaeia archaeon]